MQTSERLSRTISTLARAACQNLSGVSSPKGSPDLHRINDQPQSGSASAAQAFVQVRGPTAVGPGGWRAAARMIHRCNAQAVLDSLRIKPGRIRSVDPLSTRQVRSLGRCRNGSSTPTAPSVLAHWRAMTSETRTAEQQPDHYDAFPDAYARAGSLIFSPGGYLARSGVL